MYESEYHSAEQLRKLARQRGVDLTKVVWLGCTSCGAYTDSPAVAFTSGFGHWPDCEAISDASIQFRLNPTAAIEVRS